MHICADEINSILMIIPFWREIIFCVKQWLAIKG